MASRSSSSLLDVDCNLRWFTDGWSLLGGSMLASADRVAQMGWEPVHSFKTSLLDELPAMIDAALETLW